MTLSQEYFDTAQTVIPGGVNSPVRAFNSVGGTPVFFDSAKGAYVTDVDGNSYIDYVGSWGPMILGHAHPDVIAAVQQTAKKGLSFGAPTLLETQMAQLVCKLVPSIEKVRMVSSGTEAVMTAIRLARGHTKRELLIKFVGGYHGHVDSLLVKAGSGALTLGQPTSPGILASTAAQTLTLPYNDSEQIRAAFAQYGEQIAAVIVEPVSGNMNCIPPVPGFLEQLRTNCTEYGSLLIFDEVMTGFRVSLGGAQEHYGVTPDITTLGKIVGGGMPVGAIGGKAAIMDSLAPVGPVYQAGTLSGNPVAMRSGLTTLELIQQPGFYEPIFAQTQALCDGMMSIAKRQGIPLFTQNVGSMFGLFFTEQTSIQSFEEVEKCDLAMFNRFFHAMLKEGVYFAPSAYEAGFMSSCHGNTEIERTLQGFEAFTRTL